jgi:hypothetical protein
MEGLVQSKIASGHAYRGDVQLEKDSSSYFPFLYLVIPVMISILREGQLSQRKMCSHFPDGLKVALYCGLEGIPRALEYYLSIFQ